MSTRIRDKCHGEEEVYCIESLVFPIVVESQGGRHRRPLLHREQLLALQHLPQLVLHDVLVPPQEVLLHLVDGVVHGPPQSLGLLVSDVIFRGRTFSLSLTSNKSN